jgi:hypothetical protein
VNQHSTSKTYTGEEFAKALEAGSLKQSIVRVGMVKQDADNPQALLFSESGCGGWIKVPIEMIEEVAYLSTATCEDHEHALVQIRFKEPPDGPARVFADLTRAASNLPLSFDAGNPGDAAPGAVFQQNDGGTVGGGVGGYLDRFRCLAKQRIYYVVWVRLASGVHIPIVQSIEVCRVYI